MNYYEELSKSCPPRTGTMVGNKDHGYAERLVEATRLSELMRVQRPFCFLRLGDGELHYLLLSQNNLLDQFDRSQWDDGPVAGTQHSGNSGLGPKHAERLWKVYEQADYVDFHERNWPIEHLVKQLKLVREAGDPSQPEQANLHDFPNLGRNGNLRNIVEDDESALPVPRPACYSFSQRLSNSSSLRPTTGRRMPRIFFHQARDDGRNLDANLDVVKEDLRKFVTEQRLDTLVIVVGRRCENHRL